MCSLYHKKKETYIDFWILRRKLSCLTYHNIKCAKVIKPHKKGKDMTKKEYEKFINDLHAKGWKDEDIVKMFCKILRKRKYQGNSLKAF